MLVLISAMVLTAALAVSSVSKPSRMPPSTGGDTFETHESQLFPSTEKPSVTLSDVPSDIRLWSTYSEPTYGFAFEYPQTWKVRAGSAQSRVFYAPDSQALQWIIEDPLFPYGTPDGGVYYESCVVTLFPNPSRAELGAWLLESSLYSESGENLRATSKTSLSVNEHPALKVLETGPMSQSVSLYFASSDHIIRFGYITGWELDEAVLAELGRTCEEISATFRIDS